jgi:predicted acetyltransferase
VRQVVRFLADARSIADQVSWIGGPEDPLVHALPEKGVRVEQADHWLSRVVDARRALEIRGYPLGIRRSLVLELDDADLSWNRGAHLLEVTEGRGLVSAARGSAAPRLRLSIGAMAPLYSGHLAPSVLRAMEPCKVMTMPSRLRRRSSQVRGPGWQMTSEMQQNYCRESGRRSHSGRSAQPALLGRRWLARHRG